MAVRYHRGLGQRLGDTYGRDSTSRTRSTWREMPSFLYARLSNTFTVVSRRPVAAAMSRGVLPSANMTATWLSAALRPRTAATHLASGSGRVAASTTSTTDRNGPEAEVQLPCQPPG